MNRGDKLIEIDGKEYYGIIYKIENKITGEIYIGQTTNKKGFDGRYYFKGKDIERVYSYLQGNYNRKERHNQHLRRSIKKYGFDSFIVDKVFDVANSKEELNDKEAYYIQKFDSFKHGYNQTYGGDNFPKSKYCKNSKRICQIDLNGNLVKTWDSATDAHNEIGVCSSSISNICNNRKNSRGNDSVTSGGFVWVFEKDYDPNKDYSVKRIRQNMGHGSKEVVLLDDNNNIISEYYSLNYASENLGICVEAVRRTCMHKYKNPTYNLMYKEEYMEEQRLSEKGFVA